jgi:hypothetical protein
MCAFMTAISTRILCGISRIGTNALWWGHRIAMTALPEINCQYITVPRLRGQQLKDQSHLDGWLRDGSAAYIESLCEWK